MTNHRNLHGNDRHSHHRRPRGKLNSILYVVLLFGTVLCYLYNASHTIPSFYDITNVEAYSKLDAIVTVAMCGFNANEMVQALRKAGEWKGPIFVITDTPEAEDASLCTPIDVKHNHPTFLSSKDYDAYKEAASIQFNPAIWSKWHKTQLFQLLPDEIQTLLFLDADMLAQRPLSQNWLQSVAPLIADPECDLILNPERWYTKIPILGRHDRKNVGLYGSGMTIEKRFETRKVMEKWSDLLVREPFMGRDQGKLTDAVEATGTKICWLPSHWKHVQNQADMMDKFWFKLVGPGTFLHLASSKKGEWKERLEQKCDLAHFSDLPKAAA